MRSDNQGPYVFKDPNAELDYGVNWSRWLTAGDSIASSQWFIDPTDELTSSSLVYNTTQTTVKLSGGTEGSTYKVTNRVVTANGFTDDRTFRVIVKHR